MLIWFESIAIFGRRSNKPYPDIFLTQRLNMRTVVENSASTVGGVFYGAIKNSIVYNNTDSSGTLNYEDTTFHTSSTTPMPTNGVGNITNVPLFAAGGGVFAMGGTLNDCVIVNNTARGDGGEVYGGTMNRCRIASNVAVDGGGAWGATLNNCVVSGNTAANHGGGSAYGTLNNCTVVGNIGYLTLSGGSYVTSLTTRLCTTTSPRCSPKEAMPKNGAQTDKEFGLNRNPLVGEIKIKSKITIWISEPNISPAALSR